MIAERFLRFFRDQKDTHMPHVHTPRQYNRWSDELEDMWYYRKRYGSAYTRTTWQDMVDEGDNTVNLDNLHRLSNSGRQRVVEALANNLSEQEIAEIVIRDRETIETVLATMVEQCGLDWVLEMLGEIEG